MSSFICGSKHFNSIEKSLPLFMFYGSESLVNYELSKRFPALDKYGRQFSVRDAEKELSRIIDTLRNLNVLCVSLQYRHHYEGHLDDEIKEQTEIVFDKSESKLLTLVGLFKALGCLSYQIEIDHLQGLRDLTKNEQDALYFLDEIRKEIAFKFISDSEESENAEWEIN